MLFSVKYFLIQAYKIDFWAFFMLQLHFSFIHSNLHRQEYWTKLSSCLPKLTTSEYKKNRSNMYQLLEPYMEQAISNAKKLANINKAKRLLPGTEVYLLIEKLLPYLK